MPPLNTGYKRTGAELGALCCLRVAMAAAPPQGRLSTRLPLPAVVLLPQAFSDCPSCEV